MVDARRAVPYDTLMGRLPENVLTALRTRAKALCDLVERHDSLPGNDPSRDEVGRMIRLLAGEITRSDKTAPRTPTIGRGAAE